MPQLTIAPADWHADHREVCRLARKDRYTKNFTEIRYLEDYYRAQAVAGAWLDEELVGFVCIRNCKLKPWTTIYDLGVDPFYRGRGVGRQLVAWVEGQTPHRALRCAVEESNPALAFWRQLGFDEVGRSLTKRGIPLIQLEHAL